MVRLLVATHPTRSAITDPLADGDVGGGFRLTSFKETSDNWSIVGPTYTQNYYKLHSANCYAAYRGPCYLGGGVWPNERVYPPSVTWVPDPGYASSPTWNQLSEGAKQAVFASGLLKDELWKKAQGSGIRGIFDPGSLASQGLENLTVFGAGNTVGNVIVANLGPYGKDGSWKFRPRKGWVFIPTGSTTAYFPNNIPEARYRWNGPPIWRKGADGFGEWMFRADFEARIEDKVSNIAKKTGYSQKEINDAIHAVKNKGLPRSGGRRNPDVGVDLDTGEVYPKIQGGGYGDSIGNIFDHL